MRSLTDFTRITVAPVACRRVQLHVAHERLRYWSMADSAWRVAPGARALFTLTILARLPLTFRIPDEGRDGAGR